MNSRNIHKGITLICIVVFSAVVAACGDSSIETKNDSGAAPKANISVHGEHTAGTPLTFDGRNSRGQSLAYSWDFGDGSTATGQTVTHSYDSAGSYTVTLTVTDQNGDVDKATKTLEITAEKENPAVAAHFSVSGQEAVGKTLTFDGDASSGESLTYNWNFGDGSKATGAQVSHSYTGPGTYTVTLTVTDSAGHTDKRTRSLTIQSAAGGIPEAAFKTGGSELAGQPLSFDASASTGTGLSYYWMFGDGDAGGGKRIAHVYNEAGQYTVELTVTDHDGDTAHAAHTLTIGRAEQPVGQHGTITGTVTDVAGNPLKGVTVELVNAESLVGGSRQGTTNNEGKVKLKNNMPTGIEFVLALNKAGYATRYVRANIPADAGEAAFRATMIQREPAQTLKHVENGGSITGKDGTKITLPPNALVDANGNPVSGSVQVSLTPVDVSTDEGAAAFPGSFVAYNRSGEQGRMVSFGVAEFHISQNGEELQIAPGKHATLMIPIYADHRLDGTRLNLGDKIPFWSLDETTGQWIQEGVGTVVSSSASPTGLAFRITVRHLSWWNCDAFGPGPFYNVGGKCKARSSILQTCYITGAISGSGPAQRTSTSVGPQGKQLILPPNVDVRLTGYANNATLQGSVVVNGAPGASDEVVIILKPVNGSADAQNITLPYNNTDAIKPGGVDRYRFTATANQPIAVRVSAPHSTLYATASIKGPNGNTLLSKDFSQGVQGLVFAAPSAGAYTVVIDGDDAASGGYRLRVRTVPTVAVGEQFHLTVPEDSVVFRGFQGDAGMIVGLGAGGYRILGSKGKEVPEVGSFDIGTWRLPENGVYFVQFQGGSYSSREYHSAVALIQPPVDLTFDRAGRAVIEGKVQVLGDLKIYRFSADPGDGIYINLDKRGTNPLGTEYGTSIAVYQQNKQAPWYATQAQMIKKEETFNKYDPQHHITSLGAKLPPATQETTYLVAVYGGHDPDPGTRGTYSLRVDLAPSGNTLVVDDDLAQCPGADTRSVHAAVYAVNDGGTVDVCQGTYAEYEPIKTGTKKSLLIKGRSRNGVVLTTLVSRSVLSPYGPNSAISLKNLTVHTKSGVHRTEASVASLHDVTIERAPGTTGGSGINITTPGAVIDGLVARNQSLYIGSRADGTVVKNSKITGGAFVQIEIHGDNVVFKNNTVSVTKNGRYPDPCSRIVAIDTQNGGVKLLNNRIECTGPPNSFAGTLVWVNAADGTVIRGNTLVTTSEALHVYVAGSNPKRVKIKQNLIRISDYSPSSGTTAYFRGPALEIDVANTSGGGKKISVVNNVFDGVSGFHGGALHIEYAEKFAEINIINNTWRAGTWPSMPEYSTSCSQDDFDCSMVDIQVSEEKFNGSLPINFVNNILAGWSSVTSQTATAVHTPVGTTINSHHNLFYHFDTIYEGGGTSRKGQDITGKDPEFTNDLLEVKTTSPAIDAGQGTFAGGPPIPDVDYDGTPRPQNGNYDIGAHEIRY